MTVLMAAMEDLTVVVKVMDYQKEVGMMGLRKDFETS